MSDEDQRAEDLLARGKPSGPRLDRIWQRVEKQVVKKPAPLAWWKVMGMVFTPLGAVTAVWMLGVVPRPQVNGMQERGGAVVPPQLEASCGTPESPCRVGQPIYLRLLPRHVEGVVYVRMRSVDGTLLPVAGPLTVNPTSVVPLPSRLVPDAQDVRTGLDVEAVWRPQPDIHVDAAPMDARSVLHLVVAP